jgi:hypothetical protein
MRKVRHRALDYFFARPMSSWGGDLSGIDFENIYYYIKPTEKQAESWEDLPVDIKDTCDKLGIPEAEKKYLAGVGAQYESEVVYHKPQENLTTWASFSSTWIRLCASTKTSSSSTRRRGGLMSLRRRVHRTDLLDRLAPQRGCRDRCQEGWTLPLHDDPELVEQRLQPRDEASGRLRGRDDGVGRREPRL